MPYKFLVERVISYLFNESEMRKYIITTEKDRNNHCKHIELLLKVNDTEEIVLDN